jgi:putative ABC transport system permease protein
VDSNFFQVIELPLVEGDPATVLKQPESLVVTQATARKFFGTANAVGRTVLLGGTHSLVVTGVMRDLPHNTHLSIDMVMPNTSQAEIADPVGGRGRTAWLNVQGTAYVKLAPHADPAAVTEKTKPMLDKHVDAKKSMNVSMPGRDVLHLHLTPFRYVHLAAFGDTEKGRWETVYGFAAIAALIILIASINYMNLATARALVRAREVSLRKVMGANRAQLIAQFMGESVFMALIALVLAFTAVELLLPQFDHLLGRTVAFHLLTDLPLSLAIAGVALLVGLLGGLYPAFVLSSFRPAANLGTSASKTGGSGLLRISLVVLQFAISIGLGIAAIVIFAQIDYSQRMNLGFDRHNLLVITGQGTLTPSARDSLVQALAADPSIAGVAQSDMVPFDGGVRVWSATLPAGTQDYTVRNINIGPDFLNVYGMKLLAGRVLSRDRGTDMAENPGGKIFNPAFNILINEAAAREFGYAPSEAVGKDVFVDLANRKARLTIVGVVSDANFDGLQSAMQPFNFFYSPNSMGPISVRIKPGQTRAALAAVDRTWHRFVPTVAIQRDFQDASFDRFFIDDERQGRIFGIFVGIAIFIACLGLFGLASFTAERRTREIGIRKVHGARTGDIVRLLLWQFSIPVLIANVIAWPVAYFYLHDWLQGFAYRISLNPLYFVGAGLAALVIAWATVIVHAAHVARANPIHALRYE